MDVKTLIKRLNLSPLPMEGGYFIETYRCEETIPISALPNRYVKDKAFSTAIYYLLTPDTFSEMHRLGSDEVFHFYMGDAVEMLLLYPNGSHEIILMGNDLDAGERPQFVVPRGVWQGCRLKNNGEYALLGTTVAPAFDYEDYESGSYENLASEYPAIKDMVRKLTRK